MPNLGSLYYELFLKDLTDEDLQAIEKKLKNLDIKLDTKKLTKSLKKSVESYKGKDLALGVKKTVSPWRYTLRAQTAGVSDKGNGKQGRGAGLSAGGIAQSRVTARLHSFRQTASKH